MPQVIRRAPPWMEKGLPRADCTRPAIIAALLASSSSLATTTKSSCPR